MSTPYIQNYDGMAPGDVVTLKSGGPKMTVEGFEQEPTLPSAPVGYVAPVMVKCVWFNEAGAFSFHSFPSWTLDGGSVDDEPKPIAAQAA